MAYTSAAGLPTLQYKPKNALTTLSIELEMIDNTDTYCRRYENDVRFPWVHIEGIPCPPPFLERTRAFSSEPFNGSVMGSMFNVVGAWMDQEV